MSLQLQTHRASPVEPSALADRDFATAHTNAAASAHLSVPQIGFNPQLAGLTRNLFGSRTDGTAPDFDAQVRGTDAKALDVQMALICQDVYDPDSKGVTGWSRLTDDQLQQAGIDPASLEDPSTGFRAAIYQDKNGDHVLAFAGSNDAKDWLNNAEQGLGLPAAEYNQAVALATEAKAAFGNSLAITGHSLGGGLASIASLATDSAAVTFNASGLNDETIKRSIPDGDTTALKQQADDGLIRRYAIGGEILTGLQESTPIPDAVGHKITLTDPDPLTKPNIHWYDWADGKGEVLEAKYLVDKAKHAVDLHYIDPVITALGNDHPWAS
ncbi:hypothetical protein ACPPVV_08035 [Rhodanobacter sp. Col0626]|uniref:hypothetical protein n=1 Tax=Rhodanobacter sp. Col0626 TaxID=3415679 RepID=UPI003CF823AD